MEFVVIVIVAGYAAGLPAYLWTRRDLRAIHPHLWDTVGTPHPWRHAITKLNPLRAQRATPGGS